MLKLELGHEWLKCELVYKDGEVKPGLPTGVQNQIRVHHKKFGSPRIWRDQKGDKGLCSTGQNYLDGEPYEYSFITSKKDFLNARGKITDSGGVEHFKSLLLPAFRDKPYKATSEYIVPKHFLEKYRDKDILILGGGPSTNNLMWTKVKYDYLWSCNYFFLNKHVGNRKVDLWNFGNELNFMKDKRIVDYLSKSDSCKICFQAGGALTGKQILKIKEKYKEKCTYAHTRFRSRIGTGHKLLVLAALLQARSVSFAGLDGIPYKKVPHAFQPGKQATGATVRKRADSIFRKGYVVLWDYILNDLETKTKFYNLGENETTNLTAPISKRHFPLKRIKTTELWLGD